MTMIRWPYFAGTLLFTCLLLLAAQAASAKTYNFNGPRSWTDPSRRSVTPSSTTTGQKRLLFIRATFPDDPGGTLPTDANLNANAGTTNADYLIASYGLFSLNWTTGPTLMLPHTLAYYSAQPARTASVLADAHAIASSLGYNYANYDMDIVYIPQFYGIFTAYLGSNVGRDFYSWLEPASFLNLSYGVEGFIDDFYFPMAARADAWYSGDNTVFGTNGSVVPNGDPYDTFGAESTGANYSIYHKNEVGWLPGANTQQVTTSGTYRIYAHDAESVISSGRYYGLQVAGYQGRTYWIEYRQNPISGLSGLLINWGGLLLLDMTPGSAGHFDDAPLLIGQTFTDPNGVRINPIAIGGTTPRFVDIAVTIPGGPPPIPPPTPTPTPPPPPPTPTPTATPTPTPTPNPTPIPAPVLLVNTNTNRAIALDSVLFTAEPFSLVSSSNLDLDQRTRVMLFARNVNLSPNETFSVVTARAVDSGGNVYTLAVEYVGRVPDFDGLTTVIIKLADNSTFNGDISVSISLRGVPSNSVALAIRAP